MADEREGASQARPDPASKSKIQTGGRQSNAAQPLNAAPDRGGPERYPEPNPGAQSPEEKRSFASRDAPAPRQGAGDSTAPDEEGLLGPRGDPVEGKR